LAAIWSVGALAAASPATVLEAEKWGLAEVVLHSDATYQNPVMEVNLTGMFTSPSGETIKTEGFYDGDSIWRVRLMPAETGTWTYVTTSNDEALSGKTGLITVAAAAPNNHGPVRVAQTFHFSYADGTPYFLLGTTTYRGFGGALARAQTLARLVKSPFTKTRFFLNSEGPGSPPAFERGLDGNVDYTRPNPAFFREIETGLRELQALGIEADLILWNPGAQGNAPNPTDMTPEGERAYLRYAVTRLSAFRNVWWTVANEFDFFVKQKDWNTLGSMISSLDPYDHPLSIHHSNLAFYDNTAPWVTHTNLQNVTMHRLPSAATNKGSTELDARNIGQPVVTDEYGYEGNIPGPWGGFTAAEMVDMHWSLTMAGAYGSHGESYINAPFGEFAGDSPRRLAFLKEIMLQAPYQEMEPANDLIQYTGNTYALSALAKRGEHYLLYVPAFRHPSTYSAPFFGPGTPSKPTPLKEPIDVSFLTNGGIPIKFNLASGGIYRVDQIDTWLMKVTTLGYVRGGQQTIRPRMAPGVLRFVKVDAAEAGSALVDEFSALPFRRSGS
jgi:hypothetical protein